MDLGDGFELRNILEPGDIGQLIHIQSKYYFQEFGYGIEFEAYISKLFSEYIDRNNEREDLWILQKDGKNIGSIGIFQEDEETARLRLLFVHPEFRGLGLGTKMVDLAIKFSEEKGYSSIVLMTEDILYDAAKIYEKTGFEVVESGTTNMWGIDCQLQTLRKVL